MRIWKCRGLDRRCITATVLASCTHLYAQSIAITEYMNHPDGSSATGEWVELYNYGDTTVSLTSWSLKDDDSDMISIAADAEIGPRDFLVLARDKATFEALWLEGNPSPKVIQYGPGTFAMNDSGT